MTFDSVPPVPTVECQGYRPVSPGLLYVVLEMNSGPQACQAITLPTEPHTQPFLVYGREVNLQRAGGERRRVTGSVAHR